ncbi:MAG: SH3 domain-containing protein [Selenomonadaceae bacterium]|nr:SH3 domain-containing protein [Selenomonadaceae bacterium]
MKKFLATAAFLATLITFSAAFASVKVFFVANCNESITLRDAPSVNARELAQIPLNQGVVFIDYADNGFYRVSFGRHTGYALADYLSEKEPEGLPVGMLIKRATLFESPSTHSNAIREIISGHWVCYIGDAYSASYPDEGPDFYLIKAPNGAYGYILADRVDWNYRRR